MNGSHHCSSGLWLKSVPRLPEALEFACAHGFDFLLGPLVHPRYRQDESIFEDEKTIIRKGPFTRSDLILSSVDWGSLFVGVLSRDVNLESSLPRVRRIAEERISRELRYAAHLGLSAILLPLRKPENTNLARILSSFLLKTSTMQVWMKVPFYDESTWSWWNSFRGTCNHDRRVYLALELSATNDAEVSPHILNRWLGEPVKALIVNTSLFLTNKKGFPVLPRCIQKLMRHFFALDVQCVLEGRDRGREYRLYQQYLDHLWQQFHAAGSGDPLRQFAKGYEDHLQTPLQPLSDNLESATYEVFEKDPVKYTEYQRATYKAIVDKIPEDKIDSMVLVVMVLGAGRGPLVRAALKAADMAGRKIRVFAVEKNPNAVVTLLAQKEEDWGERVKVISSDMRDWKPEEEDKADIVISELLGSFGDNELSPECLYSAQRVLKSDAISIPTSYTSFISPIQSSKIYNEVRFSIDKDKNMNSHFETPYVVHFQNRCELAAPQPLFTFSHPLHAPIDNNRYDVKSFNISHDSELHGFGGYFECVLYKDVNISILPSTHSKGMFSWFPIFFPLRSPVKLRKGDDVELHFWRINNGKNVWYEWCLSKPTPGPVHNPLGRSYTIGL
eukprot:TRINITY_DN4721_c0_g1_i1.p1 TRINITY_DN4721_c0_g1~~TRINITY_DN4721_c0_g1_i1.p1  ORF type:complete len:624 (+),score=187.06 TRINITY_DN4721_c0_g1_i1:30-1874(+)